MDMFGMVYMLWSCRIGGHKRGGTGRVHRHVRPGEACSQIGMKNWGLYEKKHGNMMEI